MLKLGKCFWRSNKTFKDARFLKRRTATKSTSFFICFGQIKRSAATSSYSSPICYLSGWQCSDRSLLTEKRVYWYFHSVVIGRVHVWWDDSRIAAGANSVSQVQLIAENFTVHHQPLSSTTPSRSIHGAQYNSDKDNDYDHTRM